MVLCAQSLVGFFTLREMDDELRGVYLGFLDYLVLCRSLGTASPSCSSCSWLVYQAGEGQRAGRIPALIAGVSSGSSKMRNWGKKPAQELMDYFNKALLHFPWFILLLPRLIEAFCSSRI